MAAESIGRLLVRLRRERGWTQQQVADAYCDASGTMTKDAREVGRWERGTRLPTLHTRRHLAVVFGVPLSMLDRAVSVARQGRSGSPETEALTGEVVSVDRRTFVAGTAAGALAGLAAPQHVDPALVTYFEQQLAGHYRADMLLGPGALISTVTAQCDLIGQLIDRADGPTRRRMAKVGVSYATFAAWLYLDAGNPAASLQCHDVAQELAHRSHDRQAVACALVDRAMARTDQGAGRAVIDLCEGAMMDARHLPAELKVFALQQHAHGASLLGDRSQVDMLLDKAGRLVNRVHTEEWGTSCLRTTHYVEVQRATCYGRLGLAREADQVWQQIIPEAPTASRRDVGVWSARQAVAAATVGEPERAVELTRQAVDIALLTGSARTRRVLAAVETAMQPWQAEPIGQDLAEVLAPIGERV
ncbi:helix-turn-helix transcriptional regulator [Streptomyces sp. SID13666]|uniref:helix-turn-helix domain-containing protein n=1 Tax=unclassified Streptomyces TaxID=2593676 RepID=UPI0013C1D86C|nr:MULTISPECIES: helix-turn-helix transcriptional regulator [unclassified Streptomyces]NEA55844.1 helix-turn-helix transcriptional regulator [Streptomyces sp. SID13666]NEA71310.1 helix-turn-helix transcriptional regulator [Streptomyces sp. SID13588]